MPQPSSTLSDGRYQLVEVLGSGGMAVVYRAYDSRLQVERALKLLNPAMMAHPVMRKRFLSEARTMARLQHPNLMAVHDVGEDDGRVYIVMDLVEGGTLWDWVQDHGAMPASMAVGVMVKVLEGIEAAHEEHVIHRDIKPQNVLVTARGHPLVTDFGIARVQDSSDHSLTRTGAAMGTQGFMAPEQRKHAKGVDGRADVFALGGTLFALLTAETPMDIYAIEMETELFARLPAELAPIVRKATRFLPQDRYQDVPLMRKALEEALVALPEIPKRTPALGGAIHGKVRQLNVHSPGSGVDSGTMDIFVSGSDPMSGGSRPSHGEPAEGTSNFGLSFEADPNMAEPWSPQPMALSSGSGGTILPTDTLHTPAGDGSAGRQWRWLLPAILGAVGLIAVVGLWWGERGPAVQPTGMPSQESLVDPVEPESPPASIPVLAEPKGKAVAGPAGEGEDAVGVKVEDVVSEPAPPVPRPQPAPPPPAPEPQPDEPTPVGNPPALPVPAGEPAAEIVAADSPAGGRYSIRGDAASVHLSDDSGTYEPGSLPAGSYRIMADFGSGVWTAGQVTIIPGATVVIHCDAMFQKCKTK